MKKIGIIGCGTIGTSIAEFINSHLKNKAKVTILCDLDAKKVERLSKSISPRPIVGDIEEVIEKSDLIIEAASVGISGKIAEIAVSRKKDVLIMSTGGLLEKPQLFRKARMKKCSIYIPSGAICGMDGLRAARLGKIQKATLTTRKPLKGLIGAPGLDIKDIKRIKGERIIYKGNAKDAVKYFPQNINVAATLSLLGIGPRRTSVTIITSPGYKKNVHEVEIEGDFGKIFTRTENVPSKNNPKTSMLAILSAFAKLKEII